LAAYFFNKARGGQQFHLRFLAWAQKKNHGAYSRFKQKVSTVTCFLGLFAAAKGAGKLRAKRVFGLVWSGSGRVRGASRGTIGRSCCSLGWLFSCIRVLPRT
jgi:hypothetical protein